MDNLRQSRDRWLRTGSVHYILAVGGILADCFAQGGMPLLWGCVMAYLINILMNFYEKHYLLKALGAALIKIHPPVGWRLSQWAAAS